MIAAVTLELGLGIIDGRLLGYVTKKTMIYRINGADQDFIDRKKHKSITTLHVLDARKSSSGLHCPQDFYRSRHDHETFLPLPLLASQVSSGCFKVSRGEWP